MAARATTGDCTLMDRWARTFDRDPDGYAVGRPGYPDELFDVLATRCGLGPGADVVEIGPGTGQATKELLARGARVHAIEPGKRLAEFLVRDGRERLTVTVKPFERVSLRDGSADLVVSATAFHWVDAELGVPKIRSVLRPGGWVALWWNVFYDPDGPDAFSQSLEPLYEALGDRESPHGGSSALDEERWLGLLSGAGLESAAVNRFVWNVDHTTDDLVALYSTFSGTRARPAAERRRFLDGVRVTSAEEFGGHVRRRYTTILYTARKPPART